MEAMQVEMEEQTYPTPDGSGLVPLAQAFADVRRFTLAWASMLSAEDQMVQSCPEASPVKWHLAHTTWFFETFLLRPFLPDYKPLNKDYLWLFNSYYNSVSDQPDKALRASFSRPSSEEILHYRLHVEAAMERLLHDTEALTDEARSRVVTGLHHEQQHQELIAYDTKHALWSNPLRPALREGLVPDGFVAPKKAWREYSPGLVEIGHDGEDFAWDNESPRHPYYVGDFRLATQLVTCRDYLRFMEDGGYSNPRLWLSAGWDEVRAKQWQAPLYWSRDSSGWNIFTLHGEMPLAALLDTPVCHVSYYEADAYARWAGARLPSEFEWEAAAAEAPVRNAGLLSTAGLRYGVLHPTAHGSMFGGVWQWTQSAYTPYPGYRAEEGALGEYNGKFMSGQMVLRGGSVVTPAGHMRATYRNFFHPNMRWQFAGIRLAKDGIRD